MLPRAHGPQEAGNDRLLLAPERQLIAQLAQYAAELVERGLGQRHLCRVQAHGEVQDQVVAGYGRGEMAVQRDCSAPEVQAGEESREIAAVNAEQCSQGTDAGLDLTRLETSDPAGAQDQLPLDVLPGQPGILPQ